MALLSGEGFDYENAQADLVSGIVVIVNTQGLSLGSAGSRWGTGNYLITNASGGGFVQFGIPLPSTYTTGFFGCAILLNQVSSAGGYYFTVYDSANTTAQFTVLFLNDGTGTIKTYRGTVTGTLLNTTSGLYGSIQSWNYIEVGGTISSTVGTVKVQINGTQVLSLSGLNNQGSSGTTFSAYQFGSYATSSNLWVDDFYFCDNTGSAPWNTFLGDCRIQTAFATSNDSVQFTPLANANWQEISETAMDSDTSYNYSNTATNQDTFNHGSIVGTPTAIFGVILVNAVRKDDANPHTYKSVLKSGGTTAYGTTYTATSSYGYTKDVFQTDPNTSAQWVTANVNSSKIGYNLVS